MPVSGDSSYLKVSGTFTCGCAYFGIIVQADNATLTATTESIGLKFKFMFNPCLCLRAKRVFFLALTQLLFEFLLYSHQLTPCSHRFQLFE